MHLTFLSISVDFMVSILLLLMVRKKNEENNICHLQSNSHILNTLPVTTYDSALKTVEKQEKLRIKRR